MHRLRSGSRLSRRGSGPVAAVVLASLVLAGCTSAGAHDRSTSATSARSVTPGTSTSSTASAKPNIVFVLTDDLAWNLVQYMPHVQQLERSGTTLKNYYVVDSLCCPSRSAIFTGEYPHDDGVFTNGGGDDGGYAAFNEHGNEPNTFGVALQKAGYRTGFMGKYLNGYKPVDKPAAGWDEWDAAGNGYPEFNYKLNQNGTTQHYGKDAKDYLTDVLSSKATSFIDSSASSSRPFALEVATFAPHQPSTPAPRDATAFAGLGAPRTAAFDKQPANAPAWLTRIPPLSAKDDTSIDVEFRKRVQSVQAVDDMIGHLEQELQAKGLARNTYFVFSSDNGYHMGDYRLRPGKQTAFDTDIKVPLMVTGPAVPAGKQVTAMTSSIDLAPTFETLGGASVPSAVDGTSLVRSWHGQPPDHPRQGVLVEHHGPDTTATDPDKPPPRSGNPPSYEAIRTATALYVEYTDGAREYYDTVADPNELFNLAATVPSSRLGPMQRALAALKSCHGASRCQAAAQVG
ncbi:MAG: sulfatase family protein [Mycobacteriales bacterium]